jgi:hypothetical protein
MLNMTLYNILKEFHVSITVYLNIKLRGLEQYNDTIVFITKSCKDYRGRTGYLFIGMHLALKK